MTAIENGIIRQLPETKVDKIFKNCYQSTSHVFISTNACPETIFSKLSNLLDSKGLSWLNRLDTPTYRELFTGQLGNEDHPLPGIIFKKTGFKTSSETSSFQPRSVANEIRSNRLLEAILQKQAQADELLPPDGFCSLSVSVEQPLGILVDKQNKSKYSIFYYENGFDLGETLQHTDPPIQGAVNHDPNDWKTFCGIKDVLDRVVKMASNEGLTMQDYGIHQVLYKVDENTKSLNLVLIDSERFIIDK